MDKRSLLFVVALTASLFLVNQYFNAKSTPPAKTETAIERQVEPQLPVAEYTTPATTEKPKNEQFYVLENEYQQIVFSNAGGAIAEINLPLKSEKNPHSVVRPIDFDRSMEKNYPYNDHFPSFSYSIVENGSVRKMTQGTVGGYYPLLRRSIVGQNDNVAFRTPTRNYAFNTFSNEQGTAPVLYHVTRFEKDLIQFEASDSHRRIIKTYSFAKNATDAPFCFDLSIKVEGDGRGLWLSTGIPEVELISGNSSPSLKYLIQRNKKTQVEEIKLPKTSTVINSVNPAWISNSNGFLGIIVDPLTEVGAGFQANQIPGNAAPTRLTLIDAQYDLYPASKYPGYEILLPLRSTGSQATQLRVFAGPFEDDILKKLDTTFMNAETGVSPSYISAMSFQGWFTFISEPFAKFLFILMKFFFKITGSWGVSIVLLTLALRIMLYPLNGWSIKSSLRMQQIAPQVQAIQAKHKKDPKKAQLEVVALYREKGVNPLTGCFPILIQIPFLIGMFDLLKSAFELRGAPFIPGWIDNLTAPDMLFSWNYPIIFFGTDFHLLPVLLGGVMYLQQKFASPLPKDKKLLSDQQKQQKMMGNVMVVVFTVMFYHFPSGLNIYWLSSMALGILQQWIMNQKFAKTKDIVKVK